MCDEEAGDDEVQSHRVRLPQPDADLEPAREAREAQHPRHAQHSQPLEDPARGLVGGLGVADHQRDTSKGIVASRSARNHERR